MSDNLNNFVASNSSYSTPSVLYAYNYVMRVLNKMSMMTTLSLCVSCEFSRIVFVYQGGAPHFFLNRALPRLNPALHIPQSSESSSGSSIYSTSLMINNLCVSPLERQPLLIRPYCVHTLDRKHIANVSSDDLPESFAQAYRKCSCYENLLFTIYGRQHQIRNNRI